MAYEVDKAVPLPTNASGGRPHKYPFREMEVGDSFLVEPLDGDKLRNYASQFSRAKGARFVTRKQPDGSVRCWRVA